MFILNACPAFLEYVLFIDRDIKLPKNYQNEIKPRYYNESISRINIFVTRRFGLEPLNKGYTITFLVNVPFFVPSENVGKPLVGYELIVSLANSIITFSLQ